MYKIRYYYKLNKFFLFEFKMVYLTICLNHNQLRTIICYHQDIFQIKCESCYKLSLDSNKISFGIILNKQLLNFFSKLTESIENLMSLWMNAVRNSGMEYVYELNWDKERWPWSVEEHGILKQISIKSIQKYKQLMKNNRDFVNNNQDTEMINHPQFFKDIHHFIFKNWLHNSSLFIINFKEILSEYPGLNKKLSALQIKVNEKLFNEVEAQKMRMFVKYEKSIIYNAKISKRISNSTQQKQNSCPNEMVSLDEKMIHLSFLNEIQRIDSCYQIECPNEESQNKSKIKSMKNVKQMNMSSISGKVELLTNENKALVQQNLYLKNENYSLFEDNKLLMQKLEKIRGEGKPRNSSNKKERLDEQLLQQVISLQVQVCDKNHDLQILINFINELNKKCIIDKEMVNKYCHRLKTLTIDI